MATKFNVKRVVKELKDLELDPPAGIICYSKDDSLKELEARIKGPPDTPYSEGEFKLKITLPNNYPLSPPSIIFETPIYHPNIDESGVICLDILKKGNSGKWTPVQTLSTVLISLTVLLSEPNPDDPLRKEVADIFRRNPIQFRKLAEDYTLKYATSNSDADNISNSSKTENSPSEKQPSTTSTAEEESDVYEQLKKVKKQSLSLRKKEATIDSTPKSPIITSSSQFTILPTTKFDDVYQSCVYNKSLSNLSQSSKNKSSSSSTSINLAINGKRKLILSASSSSSSQDSTKTDEYPNQQKSLKITHNSKQNVENKRSSMKLQRCELKYSSSSNSSDNELKDANSASKVSLKSKYFGSGRLKSILSSQEFICDKKPDSSASKVANDSITISGNSSSESVDDVTDASLSVIPKEDEVKSKPVKNSKIEDIEISSNNEIEDEKIKDRKINEDSEMDKNSTEKPLQSEKDDQSLDDDSEEISNSDNEKADEIEIKDNKENCDSDLSSQKESQIFNKEEKLDKSNMHDESKASKDDDDIILISSSDTGSPPRENLLNQPNPDPILDSPIREDTLLDKLTNSQDSSYSIGSPPLTDKDVTIISDTESNDGIEYKNPAIDSLISRSQSSQDTRPEKSKSNLKKFRSKSDTVSSSKSKLKLKSNKNSPFSIFANSRFGKTNVEEEESSKNEDKFSPIKPSSGTQLFNTNSSSSSNTQDFKAKWGVDPSKFKTKSINLTLKRK